MIGVVLRFIAKHPYPSKLKYGQNEQDEVCS